MLNWVEYNAAHEVSLCLSPSVFHIHTHVHFSVEPADLWVTRDGFDHVVGSCHKVKGHLSGSVESGLGCSSGDCLKCQL